MAEEAFFQWNSPSSSLFDTALRDKHGFIGTDDEEFGRAAEIPTAATPQRLSDVHLASRKAIEAASRRSQAVAWLQKMVGPLDLPVDPSEEELRLCLRNGLILCNLINKIHPGAVLKIVDNPSSPSSPPPQGAALSAYQYFENVRNFLIAVEEMNIPSFECSDLDKVSLENGSLAKVIDCILALKAYYEWQSSGGQGLWKFTGTWKSPCALKPSTKLACGRYLDSVSSNSQGSYRKRWALQGLERSKSLSGDAGHLFSSTGKVLCGDPADPYGMVTDSCADWVQQLSQFVDAFHAKSNSIQDNCALEIPDSKDFDRIASESLLKLVMLLLKDKRPEEVPFLVEFMLCKVMEEFDRRLQIQAEQLKGNHCDCSDRRIQEPQMELEQLQLSSRRQSYILESQRNELKELKDLRETVKLDFQRMDSAWKNEMQALELKLKDVAQAASKYHKIAAENRELYNQVQDLKGNIRVYCRVRPFLPGQNSTQTTVDFIGEKGSLMIINPTKQGKDQRKSFNFNKVFGPSASQEEVFLDTQPLIRSVLDGYNVCIFAYGQTGSGKTYTMTGPNNLSPRDWGVNFRALHDLFQMCKKRHDFMQYEVGVQMMEIYNEQVRDLLAADGFNRKLEIRNSSQPNGFNVPDASTLPVRTPEDVVELMNLGHKNRAVGSTALNERSSRSHSVLTVHVKGTDLASGALLRGCLHLVDLAGSERVDKSEAVGDRLKEAQHINKSLSALGDVIAALAQKSTHIPYRNSKLTQLLQDSLGRQAKTLMFVHISPEDESYMETISTLKFAERVAVVELGAAQSNKESGEIRDLKDQVAFFKDALAKKDAEIERFQKDLRNKSMECAQEKSKVKLGMSPCQNLPSKMNGASEDIMSAKRRQPLEEVRNLEIRQSPRFMGPKLQVHTLTPVSRVEGLQDEDYAIKRRAEGDTVRRRSKLPRQGSCSPEEERETGDENLVRREVGFTKDKISLDPTIDGERISLSKTPQESIVGRKNTAEAKGVVTTISSKALSVVGMPLIHSFSGTETDLRFAAEVSSVSLYVPSETPTATISCCFEDVQRPVRPAYSEYCGSICDRDDDEEASSCYKEHAVEQLSKVSGNRRQIQGRSARKPSSGALCKKKTSTAGAGRALARPRRHSLVGSNKHEAGGDKPSMVSTGPQEESTSKTFGPRQSMVGLGIGASKPSKRWM